MNVTKTRAWSGGRLAPRRGRRLAGALILAPALLLGTGCERGSAPERWRGPSAADLSDLEAGMESGDEEDGDTPCEDGETRGCRVYLATHGKITSCFEGVRICEDGEWSDCTAPPGGV